MIHGKFDDVGHLFFEIELVVANGLKLPEAAMLDTGFTGFLAMNIQDLDGFEWSYAGKEELVTAQGKKWFKIYSGKIILDEQKYEVPVFASNSITEILLGSEWLKFLPLTVNYQAGILTFGN